MSLFKRHIGRRVVGVGVGVALLMLGLAAPAFAAPPAVTSFTPTSGPTNCVVVVTGTAFTDFPATSTTVDFMLGVAATPAPSFAVISATEIWVTVPALTAGSSYNIRVTNPGGTNTSTASFLSTTGAGGCAPTVTSFQPDCGSAGTTVVITGTNLLAPTLVGGAVRFQPLLVDATHTVPDVDTATSLSVIVPSGAADGPIRVTTFGAATGGQAFSTAAFAVPPPDCPSALGHTRSISLKLKDKLVAKGTVKSTEDPAFTDCAASVPVKIQRKKSGSWKTVGKTTTSDTGAYSKKIKNKKGKYRALAVKTTVPTDEVCLKAKSPVRTH